MIKKYIKLYSLNMGKNIMVILSLCIYNKYYSVFALYYINYIIPICIVKIMLKQCMFGRK